MRVRKRPFAEVEHKVGGQSPRPWRRRTRQGADPDRVGGPANHLQPNGGLSTVMAGATDNTNSALTNSLQRLHTRSGGGADRSLSTAFRAVGVICDKLGLVRGIKDRACELHKKVRHRIPAISESSLRCNGSLPWPPGAVLVGILCS